MGNLDVTHKAVFKDLMTVATLRGKDATGVLRVKCDGAVNLLKDVGLPDTLFDRKSYDKDIESGMPKVLLGHVRAKTIGDNHPRNAHPFKADDLWGVHNGTLQGYCNMDGGREYDTDSEFLYSHMAKYGVEETITGLDNDGAWALAWWDGNDQTMNFLRNDKRPLWFCHSKDTKAIYWASEPWMFSVIERRVGKDLDESGPYPLKENMWFKYEVDGFANTGNDIFTLKAPRKVEGEVRRYAGNFQGGVRGNIGGGNVTRLHGGGQVASPFLDDDLLEPDIPFVRSNLQHRQSPLELTQNLEESTPSTSSTTDSSPSSLLSTDSAEVLRKRLNYLRETVSRPVLSLPNGQSGSSGNVSRDCDGLISRCDVDIGRRSKRNKSGVSRRRMAGIEFITDNRTGREMTLKRFEELTNGICSWCDTPIGDLSDVSEMITTDGDYTTASFVCTSCTVPAIA